MSDEDDYFKGASSWVADTQVQAARSRLVAWIAAGIASAVAVFEAVAIAMLSPLKTVQPITLLGGAVLQSALAVGVDLASRTNNSTLVLDLPNQGISNVVGQQLAPGNDLRPKITVKQGASVDVFVARDLDFSGVPAWK